MRLEDYEKAETSNIDYKEKLETSHPRSWLKSVSAFANSKGGVLLYGIRDIDKYPIGIEDISTYAEKITELINSKIQPIPRFEINVFEEDKKNFLEVNVGDGPSTPYYYNSDGRKTAYIRSGNQSIEAPDYVLKNLILKGQNKTYDSLESEYTLNDLSFTLLEASLKKETGKPFDKNRDYISLCLVKDKYITNAGVLLSDQGSLKNSKIFCTKWKGTVKGSVHGDAIDDKEYNGSIISLLENSEVFIKNNSKISWEINGMHRDELEEYPTKAVREALVNAIIHRDYQLFGSEIHVDMYDDRLEITSPGGMVDGSQIQDLELSKIPSMRRNTIISDLFNRLHYMERRGSGITRMIESYSESKLKPKFSSGISYFTVIFPNKGNINNSKNSLEGIDANVVNDEDYFIIKMYKNIAGKVRGSYLENLANLFKMCGFHTEFGRENIEDIFNIKKSRASEILSQLLENDLIEYVNDSKYKFKK